MPGCLLQIAIHTGGDRRGHRTAQRAQLFGVDDFYHRLASNDGRDARRDELYGVIDRWVASLPLEQVLAALNQAEVPASRIFSAEDMFHDPQFLAREMLLAAKLPDGKAFKMPGIVPKLSETPGGVDWVGPQLGEHNQAVLNALGYSDAHIAELKTLGAI